MCFRSLMGSVYFHLDKRWRGVRDCVSFSTYLPIFMTSRQIIDRWVQNLSNKFVTAPYSFVEVPVVCTVVYSQKQALIIFT